MTSFHLAWLELYKQRDLLYLTVFAGVWVAFFWYRFDPKFYRPILAGGVLAIGLSLGWGLFHM
jgi:hypothetical protein